MNIIDSNKKIAMYMGADIPPNMINLLKYNEDWGWIMPVVEKINKRDYVTIYFDECRIHSLVVGEFETIDIINEGQPLIKSVYEAVVKYVEWYLTNVKKQRYERFIEKFYTTSLQISTC